MQKPLKNWWGVLIVVTLTPVVNGILRNSITERCIHIEKDEQDPNNYSVLANPCTFTNPRTKSEGNRNQWLVIKPLSKSPKETKYKIQQITSVDGEGPYPICIQHQRTSSSVTAGTCSSPSSVFRISHVRTALRHSNNLRRNFRLRSVVLLEQPGSKQCLSVRLGSSEMQFKNCSDNDAFQQWVVCRHAGFCDAELTWSPARIIYPRDPYNMSSDFENYPLPSTSPVTTQRPKTFRPQAPKTTAKSTMKTTVVPTKSPVSTAMDRLENGAIPQSIVINDLLYFVYNALTPVKAVPEPQVTSIMDSFYTTQDMNGALEDLRQNFVHRLDPRMTVTTRVSKSHQIVNWMRQISTHHLNSHSLFASTNMSRVPPLCSLDQTEDPAPDSSSKYQSDIQQLEKLKNLIDKEFNVGIDRFQKLKMEIVSGIDQIIRESLDSEPKPNQTPDSDELDLIDLRGEFNGKHRTAPSLP